MCRWVGVVARVLVGWCKHVCGMMLDIEWSRHWQDYFMRFTLDTFANIGFGKPLHAIEDESSVFNNAFDYVRGARGTDTAVLLNSHARALSPLRFK